MNRREVQKTTFLNNLMKISEKYGGENRVRFVNSVSGKAHVHLKTVQTFKDSFHEHPGTISMKYICISMKKIAVSHCRVQQKGSRYFENTYQAKS